MYSHVLSVSTFWSERTSRNSAGLQSPFISMELWVSITLLSISPCGPLSGLFSGLNLGLMSFTEDDLKVVIQGSADAKEVEHAEALRGKCAVLWLSAISSSVAPCSPSLVNAAIAVLLADLTSGLVGTLVTTALILVFGEILPQSVCSRHGETWWAARSSVSTSSASLSSAGRSRFPSVCSSTSYLGARYPACSIGRRVALVRLNVEDEEHQAVSVRRAQMHGCWGRRGRPTRTSWSKT